MKQDIQCMLFIDQTLIGGPDLLVATTLCRQRAVGSMALGLRLLTAADAHETLQGTPEAAEEAAILQCTDC
jgi:hypothetical protein